MGGRPAIARSSLAVAGLLLFLLLGVHGTGSAAGAAGARSPATVSWLRHTDEAAGFRIDYPDTWNRYQPQKPDVQFLAGPDENDFVEVRVFSNLPVNFQNASPQGTQQLVDTLLANQSISVIRRDQVTIGGLPGWQYIYTFTDPKLGTGVHVHVFLFQGNRLHTLVFQALPESRLRDLASLFDQILARYKALDLPGASPRSGQSPSGSPAASSGAATGSPTP